MFKSVVPEGEFGSGGQCAGAEGKRLQRDIVETLVYEYVYYFDCVNTSTDIYVLVFICFKYVQLNVPL